VSDRGSVDGREGREEESKGGALPEITKKILSLGLGAYFLTEDAIRRAVKEAKLPRDIGRSIAQNASKGKEELFGLVARELSQLLKQMDIQKEVSQFAATHRIKVTAEVEFLPRSPDEPKADRSDSGVELDVRLKGLTNADANSLPEGQGEHA
jgi:hypothetical protein